MSKRKSRFKGKRAYLNRFNRIRVPRNIDAGKMEAYSAFNRQDWQSPLPPDKPPSNITKAVFEEHRLVTVWQTKFRQGFDCYEYYTLLYKHDNITLKLFHSGHKCVLVKEYPTLRLQSYEYENKQQALAAVKEDKIRWKAPEHKS